MNGRFKVCATYASDAWFDTVDPAAAASRVTRNETVVAALTADRSARGRARARTDPEAHRPARGNELCLVVARRIGLRTGAGAVHDDERAGHERRVRWQRVGEDRLPAGSPPVLMRLTVYSRVSPGPAGLWPSTLVTVFTLG